MKANKTNLSVKELQKMIGQWKRRKITDSTVTKLLELYLGMTAYMDSERAYPVENFYDISVGLRFKNTRCMTEAVRQCGSFGIVPEGNVYGMKAFYSVLWHEKTAVEELPEEVLGTLPGNFPQDDIYNNICPKGGEDITTAVVVDITAAVKEFFHLINENAEQKAQMFTPLINWFQLHENLSRPHACDNLVYLVNELLTPYFAAQARFLKSNHVGRLCWLRNLLKSPHGQHLLNDAARAGREKREQDVKQQRVNRRNNRPLSEHEWTDPETGFRFYDDAEEGSIQIPADAQPRPSAGAVWNVLSREWSINS